MAKKAKVPPATNAGPIIREWIPPGEYAKRKKFDKNRTLIYHLIKKGQVEVKKDAFGRLLVRDKLTTH